MGPAPYLTQLSFLFCISAIGFGLYRNNLSTLSPKYAAEMVIDAYGEGLVLIDAQREIVSVNDPARRLLGYEPLELNAKSVSRLFDSDAFPTLMPGDQVTAPLRRVEALLRGKHRSGIPVEMSLEPIRSVFDEVIGYALFVTDITEVIAARDRQKQLEEKLFQSQKMETIGQLAGGIARDFNNVLTPISICAELLRDGSEDPEMKACADDILDSSKRAVDLISGLLAFSRKGNFVVLDVDVNEVVRDITAMLERTLAKNVVIDVTYAEGPLIVRADASQLLSAVLNLCLNASDAMEQSGNLMLGTSCGERNGSGFACITVTDTGVGMTEAVRQQIFEPFFTTKPSGRGTGLGLASVQSVVDYHSGIIELDSEPGRGSSFRVHLPLVHNVAMTPAIARIAGEGSMIDIGALVLIIDDDPVVVRVLESLLKKAGCHTDSGAVRFLRKPFQADDVMQLVTPQVKGSNIHLLPVVVNGLLDAMM